MISIILVASDLRNVGANGTPSRLQTTALKDFQLGLQIRCSGHELFRVCVHSAGRQGERQKSRIAEQLSELRNKKQRACTKNLMQALDLFGARSRNRTGTSLRTGDFKSHASTNFAIRAVAL